MQTDLCSRGGVARRAHPQEDVRGGGDGYRYLGCADASTMRAIMSALRGVCGLR